MALRANLDESRARQLDQRLANRLPRNAEAAGDLVLGETGSGQQLEFDDLPAKVALHARGGAFDEFGAIDVKIQIRRPSEVDG